MMIRGWLVVCPPVVLAACDSGGRPSTTPSTMSDAEILALGQQHCSGGIRRS